MGKGLRVKKRGKKKLTRGLVSKLMSELKLLDIKKINGQG